MTGDSEFSLQNSSGGMNQVHQDSPRGGGTCNQSEDNHCQARIETHPRIM
ncbi:Hypothetical protein FKW44_002204 [Caligus rogercresseyi]|uniref:Uncharacterized protein n=1 Tax=Caligus rogercresseyi TaxID=217165 RepID=A0A7T8QW63_CALRO|nr:Hypothetical protein FKW44_002204 [Caligus rogercresseyi]